MEKIYSEKDIDNAKQEGYELGKISSKEDIARHLLTQSGALFQLSKDDAANLLRDISCTMRHEAEAERKRYDRKYKGASV